MRSKKYFTIIMGLILLTVGLYATSLVRANAQTQHTITIQPTKEDAVEYIQVDDQTQIEDVTVIEHTYQVLQKEPSNPTYVTHNEDPKNINFEKQFQSPYLVEIALSKKKTFIKIRVPMEYYKEGEIRRTESITITIDMTLKEKQLQETVEPTYLYKRLFTQDPEPSMQPQETIDYLIVTNQTLYNTVNNSFKDWKLTTDDKINSIRIVNLSEITQKPFVWVNGSYGDATNVSEGNPWMPDGKEITDNFHLFNDTQCHIRNYIRYMVDTYNITYVLLLGNKDVIPPRLVEMHAHSGPSGSWYNNTPKPSDMYYSNLDYSMNNNTNSVWMECQFEGFYWIRNGDGVSEYDEIDWTYDVLVGRALVDSTQETLNWINKTKTYYDGSWQGQGNYLNNGIVATRDDGNAIDDSVWNTIGDEFGEKITFLNGQNISETQFTNLHHYCNGIEEGWDGFNIIHHAGHSGTHSGTLWDEYRPALQNNTHVPNFVYSEGCHAGDFSASASCIEDWIQDDACMIAGVSNSCWGWFTASTWYGEEMFARMFNESRGINESNFAKAHMDSKSEVSYTIHPVCPMIVKETNYFGDPSLEFQSHDMIYVDDDANEIWYDDTHVQTIQEGIAKVSVGGMVQVYNGTYALDEELYINKSLFLIGGGAETCLIERNGTTEHRLLTIENLWDNQTIVDGFTFSDGYANMSNRNGCGGNIYIVNSHNATINNSIIKEGYAAQYGGGIHLEAGGQVTNSSIYNNDVVNSGMNAGGGISLRYGGNVIKQCYISNNSAPIGGGILLKMGANPPHQNKIIHCTIANNTAHGYYGTYYGGGVASEGSGWTTSEINDSIIYYNTPNNIMDLDNSLNIYYSITTPAWSGSGNNNDAEIPRFAFNDTAINNTHYILHSCSPARATASDGTNRGAYQGSWYKPCPNYAPILGDPNPGDNATNQRTDFTWSIPIEDINWEDTFNWTITCNNSQQAIATNDSDGIKEINLTNLQIATTYSIQVNTTDGEEWANNTYTFNTTDNLAPQSPEDTLLESNTGYEKNYSSVYDTEMSVTVFDPDGDMLNVSFYLNGEKVYTFYTVGNGTVVSICVENISNASYWNNGTWEPRNILNHSTQNEWYVSVDDGMYTVEGPMNYFNTSGRSDLNEDGDTTPSDISYFISQYGTDQTPGGSIEADINEDSITSASDISYFLSDYGTTYYTS